MVQQADDKFLHQCEENDEMRWEAFGTRETFCQILIVRRIQSSGQGRVDDVPVSQFTWSSESESPFHGGSVHFRRRNHAFEGLCRHACQSNILGPLV